MKFDRPIKIAINALGYQVGGGISSLTTLINELATTDRKNEYYIFLSENHGIELPNSSHIHPVIVSNASKNAYLRVLWEQLFLPAQVRRHRIDILYCGGNLAPVFASCRVFLFIENSNPFSRLNIAWKTKHRLRNRLVRTLGYLSAIRADRIRFASENSRRIIQRDLRLPNRKCITIYHGIDPRQLERITPAEFEKLGREKYLLSVGVIAPHKNFQRLIRAFEILKRKFHYDGKLIIVGDGIYPEYLAALQRNVAKMRLEDHVRFTGRMDNSQLGAYYKNADLFVLPSVEETFGLPLVEAMAMGTPVAASDCSLAPGCRNQCFNPFREIAGEACVYFNPFDAGHMAETIHALLVDISRQDHMREIGLARSKRFHIRQTIFQLIDTLEQIYQSGNQ